VCSLSCWSVKTLESNKSEAWKTPSFSTLRHHREAIEALILDDSVEHLVQLAEFFDHLTSWRIVAEMA
jgi:hypothetical protein